MRKTPRGRTSNEKGTRNAPTQSKGKKKEVSLNTEKKKKKKKKEPDEGSTQKKRTLKCLSFDRLLGKLKVLKDVLCRNKSMDTHLMAPKEPSPLAKGKAKLHQLPTQFSLRLAALRAHQPIDKVGPSNNAPAMPDPIVISSDSKEDREEDPKGSNSEEKDPEMDPEGENQEVDSADESEEVPEYIPGEGQEENQNLGDEEPEEEGQGVDDEMDPNQDPEEDPDEDEEDDPEMEEEIEEPEVMEPDEDEYNEYFADYFELAPLPSPDSSIGSPPPTDD
ncbi:hypothetical protein PIB30_081040 [Stylosanthes scabra]|uniref:Uncharacterized protein n=1 Tax=Stylosanthes scabra TaxID=79078 RepID=A0ABU6XTD3_9FABA|nr:hypothetical protein [Stylosanthes scabra]